MSPADVPASEPVHLEVLGHLVLPREKVVVRPKLCVLDPVGAVLRVRQSQRTWRCFMDVTFRVTRSRRYSMYDVTFRVTRVLTGDILCMNVTFRVTRVLHILCMDVTE